MKKLLSIMTVLLLAATVFAAGWVTARNGTPIIIKQVEVPMSVQATQLKLIELGYDPGPADNKWGVKTETAYNQYKCEQVWPKEAEK